MATDNMRIRKSFVKMVGTESTVAESWLIEYDVSTGQMDEKNAFAKVQKKVDERTLKERLNTMSKIEANKIKNEKG